MSEEKNVQQVENFSVDIFNARGLNAMMHLSKELAQATIIPETFRQKPANVLIALNMAQRMGADPLMVMQNMYIVYGNPAWSSKFMIACFNTSGRFSSIKYEFFGDKSTPNYGCRAYATELRTGEKVVGADVTIDLAAKEGWLNKNGSKWQTMPQLMLQYRAATFLIRTVAPEISMGLKTVEEINDETIDVTPSSTNDFTKQKEALKDEVQLLNQQAQVVDVPAEPVPVAQEQPVTAKARPAWIK